eukprot:601308_1
MNRRSSFWDKNSNTALSHQNTSNESQSTPRRNINIECAHTQEEKKGHESQDIDMEDITATRAINEDIVIGIAKDFQFYLPLHPPKGTQPLNQQLNQELICFFGRQHVDNSFEIEYRKNNGKKAKVTPGFLNRNPKHYSHGILTELFGIKPESLDGKHKPELVQMTLDKLGFTNASRVLQAKNLLRFSDEEAEVINSRLKHKTDMDLKLFFHFASQPDYVQDIRWMDIYDELLNHPKFDSCINNIYQKFVSMLFDAKTAERFEQYYAKYYDSRSRDALHRDHTLNELYQIYNECEIDTIYRFEWRLLSSIIVLEMNKVFLLIATEIVYELLDSLMSDDDIKQNQWNVTLAQAASFGGASLCSCYRIYYSSRFKDATRKTYLHLLHKVTVDKKSQSDLIAQIPKHISYADRGGLYLIQPCLYPALQQILTHLLKQINTRITNSRQFPDWNKLINNSTNNYLFNNVFSSLFTDEDKQQFGTQLNKFKTLLIRMMCNKLIWAQLKVRGYNDVNVGFRDAFKFDHKRYMDELNKK